MKNSNLVKLIAKFSLTFSLILFVGCDGDSDDPGDSVASCENTGFCYIFISDSTSNGDFDSLGNSNGNGIKEADALCNADANKPNDSVYKALLSATDTRQACTSANCETEGAQENLDWVFQPNTEYRRPDGTTVIGTTTEAALLINPLDNSVDGGSGPARVWTGTTHNYRIDPSNCTNWSNGTSGVDGLNGDPASDNPTFLSDTFQNCDTTAAVYCVEQKD